MLNETYVLLRAQVINVLLNRIVHHKDLSNKMQSKSLMDVIPCDQHTRRKVKIDYMCFLNTYLHINCAPYLCLYHANENTANQDTGKPLRTRRCYIQPSHHASRVYRIDCVGPCLFYGMV